MDFNSQFSILNSVSRLAFFQPIAVLAAARYWGAATTCSLLSPKTSNASSGSVAARERSGKIGQLRILRPSWCSTFGSGMLIRVSSQSMAERYTEMLVESFVHDLRSIMTHLQVNCYSLIEEVIADAGSQAKRYGVRVRNDLQLLESSVEDMVTFTRPVSTERLPERLAVLVAEALELSRDSVRKAKLDSDSYRSNRTCQNRSSCPWRGTKS